MQRALATVDVPGMPRQARFIAQGSVQHLIARCVNGDYLLDTVGARSRLLEKLGEKAREHDCCLLAFSLMSTHLHLAILLHRMRIERLLQGVLGSVAIHINRVAGRTGHAFANRFKNIPVERESVPRLIAYIHNNEQRAGVARAPEESRWSSHRAYLGLAPDRGWLAVNEGLSLCGFDETREGRRGFNEHVVARSHDPRQPDLSEGKEPGFRAWGGWPDEFMAVALRCLGLEPHAIRIPNRSYDAVQARAAILKVWCDELGRRASELLPHLNASASAASRALERANVDQEVQAVAAVIGGALEGLDAVA